jgi:multidrug efflux system membrane fusion protein
VRRVHPKLAYTLLLTGTIGSATVACGPLDPASDEAPQALAAAAPFEVEMVAVRRGEIQRQVSAPGSVSARRESRIGPEVRGRIVHVFVDEGDRIKAGALLFQIDPRPYELALRQAEARLDLVRAERKQVEADLRRGGELKRREILAEQEMERLTTSLAVAQANERQAEEAVALYKRELERTLVRAPYDASVTERLEDEGTTALVQPQTIVIVLQEISELEAVATIPEGDMSLLRIGDPARVFIEGLASPIETKLSVIGDSIDHATRTYQVKMPVPNPDHAIKSGVFALVEIEPQAKRDVLLVPREAIRSEEGRTRVFTIQEGRATPVLLQLGIFSDQHAEVISGLSEGTQVIAGSAARNIAPGMRVAARGEPGDRAQAAPDAAPPVEKEEVALQPGEQP